MKKWLIAILVILLVLISSVYLFIPNFISINQSIVINANPDGLQRNIFNEKKWPEWWPGISKDSMNFIYNDGTYYIKDKRFSSLLILVNKKNSVAVSSLDFITAKPDSTKLFWEAKMPTSYNPLKRLQAYLTAKQVNRDMKNLLEKIRDFFSDPINIYGYTIQKALVVDTALVSTFAISKDYPGTAFIYQLIDQLKGYIISQSAKETGYPILNISTTDSINFLTRVAIPVNKILPSSGNISYKWMLGGGNILITEIRGGPSVISNAFLEVENYVNDHQRQAPAIPFLSLVTDRREEPDTNKWITRIYYPVR